MVSSKSMSDRCSWIPKLLYMSGVECPPSTLKTIPLTRSSLQLFAWQESHITEVRTASVTQVRLGYLQNWSAAMEEHETVCDAAKSRSKKMHKSEPMASLCSEAKQHAASVTQVRPGYSQNWSAALEEHETVCNAAKSGSKKMHKRAPMASLCSEAKRHGKKGNQREKCMHLN